MENDDTCSRRPLWVALLVLLVIPSATAVAQWSTAYEQFYLPARHNWVFRKNYPAADRLFNAFDYGHAILYEKLYTKPAASPAELEEKEYRFVTERLLVRPPRVPLEEGAIEVAYAKLAPEAKLMFEWAHILHRQIYDVLADERLSQEQKDAAVAELVRYYRSRPKYAFSSVPKSMELMEGQYYSQVFRQRYPRFNGLIWAYHWLQVGLYEPLLTGRDSGERHQGVTAAVGRFWQMLEDSPEHMPRVMPMTPAVAPTFAARYPEAAIIFDNLHGMHDVISDILASPEVPRQKKREEILRAAERYRDDTSFTMTVDEWLEMATMMGSENMGGVANALLAPLPEPTLAPGASHAQAMQHGETRGGQMDHGAMQHGAQSAARDSSTHASHAGQGGVSSGAPNMHEGAMTGDSTGATGMHGAMGERMMDMHEAMAFLVQLLSDPDVEARIHSDPRLHQLWTDPQVQQHLERMRQMHAFGSGHDTQPPAQQPQSTPHQH